MQRISFIIGHFLFNYTIILGFFNGLFEEIVIFWMLTYNNFVTSVSIHFHLTSSHLTASIYSTQRTAIIFYNATTTIAILNLRWNRWILIIHLIAAYVCIWCKSQHIWQLPTTSCNQISLLNNLAKWVFLNIFVSEKFSLYYLMLSINAKMTEKILRIPSVILAFHRYLRIQETTHKCFALSAMTERTSSSLRSIVICEHKKNLDSASLHLGHSCVPMNKSV